MNNPTSSSSSSSSSPCSPKRRTRPPQPTDEYTMVASDDAADATDEHAREADTPNAGTCRRNSPLVNLGASSALDDYYAISERHPALSPDVCAILALAAAVTNARLNICREPQQQKTE